VQLQQVDNKFTYTVYLWLDNIIARFITKFAVDTAKSYTVANMDFLKDIEVGTSYQFILQSIFYCMKKV
jgi:hypothetical protein